MNVQQKTEMFEWQRRKWTANSAALEFEWKLMVQKEGLTNGITGLYTADERHGRTKPLCWCAKSQLYKGPVHALVSFCGANKKFADDAVNKILPVFRGSEVSRWKSGIGTPLSIRSVNKGMLTTASQKNAAREFQNRKRPFDKSKLDQRSFKVATQKGKS